MPSVTTKRRTNSGQKNKGTEKYGQPMLMTSFLLLLAFAKTGLIWAPGRHSVNVKTESSVMTPFASCSNFAASAPATHIHILEALNPIVLEANPLEGHTTVITMNQVDKFTAAVRGE